MSLSREHQGDLFIFSEAILWGLFPVITILSYNSISPLISLTISSFLAAIFLGAMITIKKCWHEILKKEAYKNILLATFFIGIVYYLLSFFALKLTSAGNVAIVALTEVGFSFLLFHVLKKEHVPQVHIIGAVLMIFGAIIILLPNFTSFKLGDVLILLASSLSPIGNSFAQKARKQVSSETIMFIRSVISAFVILIIALAIKTPFSLSSVNNSLFFLLVNGFVIFGFSKILWIEGIHRISVPKANALSSIAPFFTLACAWAFLNQTPTAWQLLSLFPICAGVILLSRVKTNPPSVPEAN